MNINVNRFFFFFPDCLAVIILVYICNSYILFFHFYCLIDLHFASIFSVPVLVQALRIFHMELCSFLIGFLSSAPYYGRGDPLWCDLLHLASSPACWTTCCLLDVMYKTVLRSWKLFSSLLQVSYLSCAMNSLLRLSLKASTFMKPLLIVLGFLLLALLVPWLP